MNLEAWYIVYNRHVSGTLPVTKSLFCTDNNLSKMG